MPSKVIRRGTGWEIQTNARTVAAATDMDRTYVPALTLPDIKEAVARQWSNDPAMVPVLATALDYARPAPFQAAALPAAVKTLAAATGNNAAKTVLAWISSTYPGTGQITNFGGVYEANIRPPASAAFGLAALIDTGNYNATTTGVTLAAATAATKRLITSVTKAHVANGGTWGGYIGTIWDPQSFTQHLSGWQSSLWAAFAANAAWLIQEDMTVAELDEVRNMLTVEADRFLTRKALYYKNRSGVDNAPERSGDSKGEELAWDAYLLGMAALMVPAHDHAEIWMDKMVEFQIASTAVPADVDSPETLHGMTVGDLINGSNLNADGTLHNHGFINPNYMAAMGQNWLTGVMFIRAGKKMPASTIRNGHLLVRAMTDVAVGGSTIYTPGSAVITYPGASAEGDPDRMACYMAMDALAHCLGLDWAASTKSAAWAQLHAQKQLDMQNANSAARRSDWDLYHAGWVLLAEASTYTTTVRATTAPSRIMLMQARAIY